jgi:hypothetical protein
MIGAKVRALENNSPTLRKAAKQARIDHGYVNQASIGLQFATDLVDAVIIGPIALKLLSV